MGVVLDMVRKDPLLEKQRMLNESGLCKAGAKKQSEFLSTVTLKIKE